MGRGPPRPALPQHVDVESQAVHVQPEVDRRQGALLADDAGKRGDLVRGFEAEPLRVARIPEFFDVQGPGHGGSHADSILVPGSGRTRIPGTSIKRAGGTRPGPEPTIPRCG